MIQANDDSLMIKTAINAIGRTYTCWECRKQFLIPTQNISQYIYRYYDSRDKRDHVFCSWSCFSRDKERRIYEFLDGGRKYCGMTEEECNSWLVWRGKEPRKRKRASKNVPKVEIVWRNRFAISLMRASGISWQMITKKLKLDVTPSYLHNIYYELIKQREDEIKNEQSNSTRKIN